MCTNLYHDTVTFQRPALRSEFTVSLEFPSERGGSGRAGAQPAPSLLPLVLPSQLHPTLQGPGCMHREPPTHSAKVYLHFLQQLPLGCFSRHTGGLAHSKEDGETFLTVHLLRLHLLIQGVQVQSLVQEQRSHIPHGHKNIKQK